MLSLLSRISVLWLFTLPAIAHDFWLTPNTYTANGKDEISIDWRVGDSFVGESLVYLPKSVVQIGVIQNGQPQTLEPRFAAKPAMNVSVGEGSTVAFLETKDFNIQYTKRERFESFVNKEQIGLALPAEIKLPIEERYRRYAKTLIKGSSSIIQDTRVGLDFEWVLREENQTIVATLWHNGERAENYVAKVFRRADAGSGKIVPEFFRTDSNGEIELTMTKPGEEVMLNSVALTHTPTDATPWFSQWASITFQP